MNDIDRDRELTEAILGLKNATEGAAEMSLALKNATEVLGEILDRRYPSPLKELISPDEAAKLLGCSRRSLDTYRQKHWLENVHFFAQGKSYRYNRVLLQHWLKNRFNEAEHQRAIEQWLKQQPQNQPETRGRKASNK